MHWPSKESPRKAFIAVLQSSSQSPEARSSSRSSFLTSLMSVPSDEVKYKLGILYNWLPYKMSQDKVKMVSQADTKKLEELVQKFGFVKTPTEIDERLKILEATVVCGVKAQSRMAEVERPGELPNLQSTVCLFLFYSVPGETSGTILPYACDFHNSVIALFSHLTLRRKSSNKIFFSKAEQESWSDQV